MANARGAIFGAIGHFHVHYAHLVGEILVPMRDGDDTCLDCKERRRVVAVRHHIAIVKLQLIVQQTRHMVDYGRTLSKNLGPGLLTRHIGLELFQHLVAINDPAVVNLAY